jgi:hypothetical protein
MRVDITAEGGGLTLHSLYHWLREDDDVVRVAELSAGSTANTGRMGTLDVVNVVLANAVGFSTLVMGYVSWRAARAETADVTFTIDGLSVTVRNASAETVQRLLALVERSAREDRSGD